MFPSSRCADSSACGCGLSVAGAADSARPVACWSTSLCAAEADCQAWLQERNGKEEEKVISHLCSPSAFKYEHTVAEAIALVALHRPYLPGASLVSPRCC